MKNQTLGQRTYRRLILDVLESGPKKLLYIVELLENNNVYNSSTDGVKPIQTNILQMLKEGKLELTADMFLKTKRDNSITLVPRIKRLPRYPYATWDRKDNGNHQELIGLSDVLALFGVKLKD